jgi:hypothetical protein
MLEDALRVIRIVRGVKHIKADGDGSQGRCQIMAEAGTHEAHELQVCIHICGFLGIYLAGVFVCEGHDTTECVKNDILPL